MFSAASQTELDEMEVRLAAELEAEQVPQKKDRRDIARYPASRNQVQWWHMIAAFGCVLVGYWMATIFLVDDSANKTMFSPPESPLKHQPVKVVGLSDVERQLRDKISSLEAMVQEMVAVKQHDSNVNHRSQEKQQDNQVATHDQFVAFQGVVQTMIESSLTRFANDRVGMADYALTKGGARVVSELTSATFNPFAEEEQLLAKRDGSVFQALLHTFGLEMVPISMQNGKRQHGAVTALQSDVSLGNCWPMLGDHGVLTVDLSRAIQPTAITLDHIPRSLTLQHDIRSAPRDFEVWSMTGPMEESLLLKGTFDIVLGNHPDKGMQTFPISTSLNNVKRVQLRIFSNHGHDLFTCLYR